MKFFRRLYLHVLAGIRKVYTWVRWMFERSLVSRLLFLLMTGSVVMYLIVNVGLWWTASDLIDDNLEKQAVRWLSELDELGTPLYASYGGKHASNIDKRIKNFPEIAFIRYYDASGKKILGEFGNKHGKVIPPLEPDQIAAMSKMGGLERTYLVDRSLLTDSFLRFITPIRVRSMHSDGLLNFSLESEKPEYVKVIGYLDLSIDSAYYKGQLVRSMATGSLIIAGLLLLGMLFGGWIIQKALAPLTALKIPLARLAQGETDVTVERPKDAEIAAISDALNTTIKAIKERDEALRKMAESDPLTGLVNRNYFTRVLAEEIDYVAQNNIESAVYFIDLDKFKLINDTYGHSAGDTLLIRVAELLKSRAREQDVVCRIGGDEFTVLARSISREAALNLAGSFNRVLNEARIAKGDHTFSVNCSVGIAMIDTGKHSVDEILSHADTACFASKSNGRNCFHMYENRTESQTEIAMDTGWFKHIQETIRDDKFVLVYQPILNSADSGEEYYEALLRMPGPKDELVLPAIFLPVAERLGLMVEIDRWVIGHAMKSLASFRASGRNVVFSINLSGQSLEDKDFLQLVRDQMELHKLPPGCVVFEITEQTALRHLQNAKRLIAGLHESGCRLALDDFGTGFSSFAYLKNLPVDFIKIDGSFINSMMQNAIDETMVLSIIHIARSLGMKTIAEFVPDEKTMNMLKKSGVDYMQGYFVGTPTEKLPAALRLVPPTSKRVS